MTVLRATIAETTKALAVLALVFLAFAHAPLALPASADEGNWTITSASYCGKAPDADGTAAASPCVGCFNTIAGLPPEPCALSARFAMSAGIGGVLMDAGGAGLSPFETAHPRAPPVRA